MKKINRHNYEVFFVDYFDNELNENETKLLFEFLNTHPHLKEEFESFENFTLEEQETSFENKSSLKKHIDETTIDHYIIADLEGELTIEDQKEYTDFLAENSLYAPIVERYKRTILPQENIIYPNKRELKQKSKLIVLWPTISAIAAALLLFIVLNNQPILTYQFQAVERIEFETIDSTSNDFDLIKEASEPVEKEIAKNESTPTIKIKKSIKKVKTRKQENGPKETIAPEKKKIDLPIINKTIDNNNDLLADNNSNRSVKPEKENIPTIKQVVHDAIKSSIFRDKNKNNRLIDKEYLIAATTEKLNQSKNIFFEQTKKKKRKKTILKIGKFEFYRNKKV